MRGTIHTEDKLGSLMAELNTLNAGLDLLLPLETTLWPPMAEQIQSLLIIRIGGREEICLLLRRFVARHCKVDLTRYRIIGRENMEALPSSTFASCP
jgi:hypothetical protein